MMSNSEGKKDISGKYEGPGDAQEYYYQYHNNRRKIQVRYHSLYRHGRIGMDIYCFIDHELRPPLIEGGEHSVSVYFGSMEPRFLTNDDFEERKARGSKYPKINIPISRDDKRTIFVPEDANTVIIEYDVVTGFFRSAHGKIKDIRIE